MILNQWNQAKLAPSKNIGAKFDTSGDGPVVKVLIHLADGATFDDIKMPGMTMDDTLPSGNILADMPLNLVNFLAKNDKVSYVSFGDTAETRLDEARKSANVDAVHNGTGLIQAYTGKGVLCGIYDSGMDPNHITFTNGGSRVVAFNNGSVTYTPENMANAYPDSKETTHGTHCAGILAGNSAPRRSGSTDGTFNSGYKNGSVFTPLAMPYQGVAKGADIYMVGGIGEDNAILSGVNRIINYGKEKGQPVVVSLSWGSNVGPHDGSRSICQELDAMAKDAIIVIAAGNEGSYNISCTKKLSGSDNALKTFVAGSGNTISGTTQFWANDNQKLSGSIGVYDLETNQVVKTYDIPSSAESSVNASLISAVAFQSGSKFDIGNDVNSENNRAYITIRFNINLTNSNKLVPFVAIKGASGQTIYGVCEKALSFSSNGISGYTDGTPDESISDMACGRNAIVVGAYTTRNRWYVMPANSTRGYVTPYTLEDIAPFSSYGTAFGGRNLPDICAPGAQTISSISSYYTEDKGYSPTAECDASGYYRSTNGRTYYFETMQGTSMATPFVAGVIALWLEAKPDLTTYEIRDLLKKSAKRDDFVTSGNSIKWGYGKIDALEGIKQILAASVNEIGADVSKRLIIEKNSARNFTVSLPGADNIGVRIYSVSGATVMSVSNAGSNINLDASTLTPGVYILEASDSYGRYTEKILL